MQEAAFSSFSFLEAISAHLRIVCVCLFVCLFVCLGAFKLSVMGYIYFALLLLFVTKHTYILLLLSVCAQNSWLATRYWTLDMSSTVLIAIK
jgi:hypothetical protein